jgi:hypothetical protein
MQFGVVGITKSRAKVEITRQKQWWRSPCQSGDHFDEVIGGDHQDDETMVEITKMLVEITR